MLRHDDIKLFGIQDTTKMAITNLTTRPLNADDFCGTEKDVEALICFM